MFERNLAFIIGINHYQGGISSLKTAVNDAQTLAAILREKHNYQVWECLDEVASLSSLNQVLEQTLPAQVTENDRLLFYFAGHGVALNGDDGPMGYLIPQDAKQGDTNSYLPMTRLHDALSNLPCRHFLGILDCCFAGAFRWSSTRDLITTPEVIYQERYDRFIRDAAWQIITSSASDQKALDNFSLDTERGQVGHHSPFAAALLEALAGAADSYPPPQPGKSAGDGVITATELYLYLRDRVEVSTEKYRLRQTPGIWSLNKHDKGEYIFLSPNHELNLPPAPPLDESQNPYRGLQAFGEEHSELFFGRQALTEQLYQHVCQRPFTVVLGASGTGKSSLVQAGLIAYIKNLNSDDLTNFHLNNQQLPSWQVLPPMRPGESPLMAFNQILKTIVIKNNILINPDDISSIFRNLFSQNPQIQLLLVIDQSEELITLCQDERERASFLKILQHLIANYSENIHIVLTLRSDFEPQLANTCLEPYWYASRFIVPAMTREELRAAIEKPASARVMYFDPHSLVDQLIDEVAQMPGALPLLSFSLSELYLQYLKATREGSRSDRAITQADYEQLGGVTRSLTQRADREHDNLVKKDTAYSSTIRKLMLRMVAVGGGELARRRVALAELEYPEPENSRIHEVIRRFTDARLLVEGQDADNQPYVEPAHDALVRGWQKLLAWKQDEEENIILQRRLTPAAVEWQSVKNHTNPLSLPAKLKPGIDWLDGQLYRVESIIENTFNQASSKFIGLWRQYMDAPRQSEQFPQEKPTAFLWNGNPYLDVLKQQLNSPQSWFNKLEAEFVQASLVKKRQNVSWRSRITISVISGLSALTIGLLFFQRDSLVEEAGRLRKTAEISLNNNQSLDGMIDVLQAGQTLKQPLLQLFPPHTLISEQIEGTLQRAIYTVRERNRLRGDKRPIRSVVFSPDGQRLATGGDDGKVRLWSSQGQLLHQLEKHKDSVRNVKFTSDGQLVITAGDDGLVRLWDLQGNLVKEWNPQQGELLQIALSPDGKIAIAGGAGNNHTVKIWDLQGLLLVKLSEQQTPVRSLSFSPNGQFLASGGDDNTIRLWNTQGQKLTELTGHQAAISGLVFSRDSQILASSGEDGFVRIWEVDSNLLNRQVNSQVDNQINNQVNNQINNQVNNPINNQVNNLSINQPITAPTQPSLTKPTQKLITTPVKKPIQEWNAQQRKIWSIVFSPDNQQLATAGGDGTVRIWNLQGRELERLVAHQGPVRSLSFDVDGQQLASSSDDTTVRIWDLRERELNNFTNPDFASNPDTLSLGGNDQQIVSANNNGTIRLWDLQGQNVERQFTINVDNLGSVTSITLSRDGQTIIIGNNDGNISLWNLQGQPLGNPFPTNAGTVTSLDMSPDGTQILSGTNDGKMYVWNRQGQPLREAFTGHLGRVNSVAFSQDGQQIVSGGDDGTVRLWNPNTQWTRIFQVYGPKITAVSFTPDGKRVISSDATLASTPGNSNARIAIWNLQDPEGLLPLVIWDTRQSAINSIQLSRDGERLTTIARDGSLKLWSIESSRKLKQRACNWIKDYREHQTRNNQNLSVCNQFPKPKQ